MIEDKVSNILKTHGFERFGFATLNKPMSFSFYKAWIDNNHYGDMKYLKEHIKYKEKPNTLLKKAKSGIVVAVDYLPHPHPQKKTVLKTALYAQGEDYHYWLKDHLQKVIECLKQEFSDHNFAAFTDSAPILERDLAYRAGLGWIGKNTCLLSEKTGSLFVIGEIYTTLDLTSPIDIQPDRCGTCTKCIDICPTQAITSPRYLEADKCISYLTIERKSLTPSGYEEAIKDWYFGCDLCQTICPWNKKIFEKKIDDREPTRKELIEDLQWILTSSHRQILKHFKATPLNRLSALQHKRNAICVIASLHIKELRKELLELSRHPKLKGMALWALKAMTSE